MKKQESTENSNEKRYASPYPTVINFELNSGDFILDLRFRIIEYDAKRKNLTPLDRDRIERKIKILITDFPDYSKEIITGLRFCLETFINESKDKWKDYKKNKMCNLFKHRVEGSRAILIMINNKQFDLDILDIIKKRPQKIIVSHESQLRPIQISQDKKGNHKQSTARSNDELLLKNIIADEEKYNQLMEHLTVPAGLFMKTPSGTFEPSKQTPVKTIVAILVVMNKKKMFLPGILFETDLQRFAEINWHYRFHVSNFTNSQDSILEKTVEKYFPV